MNVIRFFARNARSRLVLAVVAGMISGLCSMALLALFTKVLRSDNGYSSFTLAYV
jgi:hypothetical protein